MTSGLTSLLNKNGYAVYQANEYFIVRKKVFASWGVFALFLVFGLSFITLGLLIVFIGESWMVSLPVTAIGIVLILAPFSNYLTGAYRSIVIDRHNKTILFRSGYSRAYLFTEVNEVKLGVQAMQANTNAFSNPNRGVHYTITAYMTQGDKEELFSLKFRNEENECLMFNLKDYFQTLLIYSH